MRGEPMSRFAKCRYYCRAGTTFLFSHIGLCGLVVGYTIMGAFTFEALEAHNEQKKRMEMQKERGVMVEKLWSLTVGSQVLAEGNWTENATDALRKFEQTLVRAVKKEGFDGTEEGPLQWSFSGALLYSIIVITTIGYGNITPKTPWGKIVTILYAIVGIPLLLLCLSNIGDVMAHSFKFLYWKVCCYFCIKPKKRRKYRHHPYRGALPELGKSPAGTPQSTLGRGAYYRGPVPSDDYGRPPGSLVQRPLPYVPPADGRLSQRRPDCSGDRHVPVISNKYVMQAGEVASPDLLPPPRSVDAVDPARFYHPSQGPDRGAERWDRKQDEYEEEYETESEDEEEEEEEAEEASVPIWLCLAVMVGYICGGAVLFTFWEHWEFLDSSYFCFITLTTIGFGDMVPGTAVVSDDAQLALGLCSLYLLFGMALLAMSFNLVQEEVRKSVRCIGKRIGILADDDEDDDG